MELSRERRELTREAARLLAERAHEAARAEGIAIAVAVVDPGGHLILLDRMDGAATCAAPLAQSKADTAVATLAPTEAWFVSSQPGNSDWGMHVANGGRFNTMPGGIPVEINGIIVGAVGVSGGEASQDVRCAAAAVASLVEIAG